MTGGIMFQVAVEYSLILNSYYLEGGSEPFRKKNTDHSHQLIMPEKKMVIK